MQQDTINEAIKQHEGLIFYTIQYLNCAPLPEYISAGYEALWRALQTYDEDNGTEFSTYAVTCIKNAIYNVFRAQKGVYEHEVSIEEMLETLVMPSYEKTTTTHKEVHKAVDEALNYFTGKKLSIAKYWINGSMSATAIAQEVGCSQSYASQVIKEVQAFLRKELLNAGYSPRIIKDKECL